MLGTNELKVNYNKSAEQVGEMLEEYIIKPILIRKFFNSANPKVIIIAPAKINSSTEYVKKDNKFNKKSEEQSELLEKEYKKIAERNGCFYVSALDLETGVDGLHLTEQSHRELADRVFVKVKEIFPDISAG
jgi:lysophospholipase L1-like esterase